ncbi:hypothetical protein Taro_019436 [Colocasia esculenta]|uniref:RNase H type-1 domain-containing protein n=1 Tax=Colocasia esculenta TaxID=4460 RepID=A0A843UZ94_COLES|nr:hypothetical protein [Colocasia esculenta]
MWMVLVKVILAYVGEADVSEIDGVLLWWLLLFYGQGNCLIAEARALCDGLRVVDFLGIRLSIIYSDSALINSFKSRICPSWQAYRWWREVKDQRKGRDPLLRHCYHETNQVVDALANFGCWSKENNVYWGSRGIPHIVLAVDDVFSSGTPNPSFIPSIL